MRVIEVLGKKRERETRAQQHATGGRRPPLAVQDCSVKTVGLAALPF